MKSFWKMFWIIIAVIIILPALRGQPMPFVKSVMEYVRQKTIVVLGGSEKPEKKNDIETNLGGLLSHGYSLNRPLMFETTTPPTPVVELTTYQVSVDSQSDYTGCAFEAVQNSPAYYATIHYGFISGKTSSGEDSVDLLIKAGFMPKDGTEVPPTKWIDNVSFSSLDDVDTGFSFMELPTSVRRGTADKNEMGMIIPNGEPLFQRGVAVFNKLISGKVVARISTKESMSIVALSPVPEDKMNVFKECVKTFSEKLIR